MSDLATERIVWCAYEQNYEETEPLGVFATEEGARRCCETAAKRSLRWVDDGQRMSHSDMAYEGEKFWSIEGRIIEDDARNVSVAVVNYRLRTCPGDVVDNVTLRAGNEYWHIQRDADGDLHLSRFDKDGQALDVVNPNNFDRLDRD